MEENSSTKLVGERVLLRVYLHSADRAPHTPTYERIVRQARNQNLAGLTVLRGILGYGSRGLIQPSRWTLAEHVPVIVEIVDDAARLGKFINETLTQLMIHGMLTLERANVMLYRHGATTAQPGMTPQPLKLAGPMPPLSNVPPIAAAGPGVIQFPGSLLRVLVGESDHYQQLLLYEAIVQKVRELGLAGATVLRGVHGFGANSVVNKAKARGLSADSPIVVEITDTAEKIQHLLPFIQMMMKDGMMTMEEVAIILFRIGDKAGAGNA